MKKNKQTNTKGFTLIEIIAAVTILGILSVVAIVSVNKIIQNAKEKHYTTAEKQLELAGQSYVQQYRSTLPKAIGQKTKISLEKLVNTNFIKPIEDYSGNQCDLENSYVQVFKYSQSDYSYKAYLKCDVYDTTTDSSSSHNTEINATLKGTSHSEEPLLTMEIKDEDKLISYSYIIYKQDKEVKNSGSISLPNYDTTITKTVKLEEYTPGNIKVVVTATDIYGETASKTVKATYEDRTKPVCIIKDEDKVAKPWTKENRKITVGCIDADGSGCERDEYSKTFKTTTEKGKVRIYDNAGNYTDCEVYVNVDKTAPTVPTVSFRKWRNNTDAGKPYSVNETGLETYTTNTWSNLYVFTEASGSTDSGSGNIQYQYTTTGATEKHTNENAKTRSIAAEGISTIKYRACDAVGNCSAYTDEYTIKIDTTAPTVPTVYLRKWSDNSTRPTSIDGLATYTAGTWSNLYVYTRASDSTDADGSGNIQYKYTTTGETTIHTNQAGASRSVQANGTSTIKYKACDEAGNCSAYTDEYTIKIDTAAPTVPTVYLRKWSNNSTRPTSIDGLATYTADTWSNLKIYTAASDSSDEGGSGGIQYQYTTTGATTHNTNKENASRSIEASGTSYIKYRACDAVGNCSAYTDEYTIKVDTIAPGTPNVYLRKWSNNSTTPTSIDGLATYTADTWSKKYIYTKAYGSTDTGGSNGVYYQYTTTGETANATNTTATTRSIAAQGTSYIQYRACDAVGNCSEYSDNYVIKIDSVNPTCNGTTDNTSWTNSNVNVRVNCSDGVSGCTSTSIDKSYNSGTVQTDSIAISDNAGNSTTCAVNVYLDKTAPTTPTTGSIGTVSGTNTTGTIKTAAGGSTDTGGSGVAGYRYLVTNSSTKPSKTAVTGTALTFTRSCGTTYYAWAVAVDNVGNISAVKSLGNTSDAANSYSEWTTCSATCGGGTKTRTNTCALIASEEQSCNTHSCTTCLSSAEIFGSDKGTVEGNFGAWVDSTDEWGEDWCHANGTTCDPGGGYLRICIHESCKGMTAKEIKEATGCKYSNYWCKCE